MRQTVRLTIMVWWAAGMAGAVSPDNATADYLCESLEPPVSVMQAQIASPVGMLSQQAHQQLLALLAWQEPGRTVPRSASEIDSIISQLSASTGDAPSAIPQRIPEPGMVTLLGLAAAVILGHRRRSRAGRTCPR